jgi:uncharacterized protein YrzB (UPF0473 family)
MSEEEDEFEVLVLPDEDGNEREFALLTLVELEEGTFAILAPLEQVEGGGEEEASMDLYAFTYAETDDGVELDEIEDEALVEKVFGVAEEILFGDFEDEDDDEEEDEDSKDEA